MKSIIIILLCIGVIMVVTGYNKSFHQSKEPKIEYRYVPRTFFEEQIKPTNVKQTFSSMFNSKSPFSRYTYEESDIKGLSNNTETQNNAKE